MAEDSCTAVRKLVSTELDSHKGRREPARAIGYHCHATAMIERSDLSTPKLHRDMTILRLTMLIGRLAIDQNWQEHGLGSELLVDAVRRCVAAPEIIGARRIIAHAIENEAVAFYRRHGFLETPVEHLMLLPMEQARALIGEGDR